MTELLRATSERPTRRRRPAWRQNLVEAERGFALGFRADSSLVAFLFFDLLLLAAGGVLGLELWQWLIFGSSCAFALCLMLVNLAINELLAALQIAPMRAAMVQRMLLAAVTVAIATQWILALVILWQPLKSLLPTA